jgi:hypothetical protein
MYALRNISRLSKSAAAIKTAPKAFNAAFLKGKQETSFHHLHHLPLLLLLLPTSHQIKKGDRQEQEAQQRQQ